jgi:hypothetical protein
MRLVAEQMLRERPGGSLFPVDARLVAAGAALVAAGALTLDAARAIDDAYSRTLRRRGPGQSPLPGQTLLGGAGAEGAAAEPGRWHVVPSGYVIVRPWGQLVIGYVLLTDEATVLKVAVHLASPGASSRQGAPWGSGLPRTLEISDDQGTTSSAHFEIGRRRDEQAWHGTLQARPPLAPGTAWISVLGERLDLTGEPPVIQSWAEQLWTGDAVRHHLWERVATRNDFHDPRAALEAAIEALVAGTGTRRRPG